ncbi:hypothetical protein [Kitasatospora sp. NPDC057500]|uniref:hypothetical protein n=1 Tax=Kitasatospora sp. NPDC057500 TaxID=3346151 RepID=UPI0036D128AA
MRKRGRWRGGVLGRKAAAPPLAAALSGGGGAVVADGMLHVRAAHCPQCPSTSGGALPAPSLR